MVQANVDKIIDFLKTKKTVSLPEMSKALGIPKEDIQKSVEYLEEDGVLKMDYKFTTPYITFLKDPFFKGDIPAMKLEEPKEKPKAPENIPVQKPEQNFFLNEPANYQKITPLAPPPEKNLSASMTFMQMPSDEANNEIKEQKAPVPDINPFDVKPSFDLNAPMPEGERLEQTKPAFKPVLGYTEDYSEEKETRFPEYVSSDLDKLDFEIDEANKKISNYQYKGMNVTYRRIFNLYRDANLSPNEKYLMGSKVNELFQRIKRIYLIEKTV
jgi:hypothetical protein